jgi:glycosyltransferase involved in cell wall biosynthesis
MKITGCIIAKNEEKDIEQCIISLNKVCDEIIFVDTESTDKTINIAKELGVKLFYYKWIDNFAAAKNFAISKAKGDWIIFLDADEYLVDSKKEIYVELATKSAKYECILCEILNFGEEGKVCEKHLGSRFFKNDRRIKYSGRIHEQLVKNNKPIESINGASYIKIIHKGYTKEKVISKNKFQRNIKLLFKELEEHPHNPQTLYYIADTYGLVGDSKKQVEFCRKSISAGKIPMKGFDEVPYLLLVQALFGMKEKADIIKVEVEEAIREFPESPVFRYYCALLYLDNKKYIYCLNELFKALELNERYDYYAVDYMYELLPSIYKIVAYIYSLMKKKDLAIYYYIKVLKLRNSDKETLLAVIELLKGEDQADTIVLLNRIYNINYIKDMEFVVEVLTASNNAVLLSHYIKRLSNLYKEGTNAVLISLLRNGSYENAFKMSYEIYNETFRYDVSIIMVTAALCSKKH